MVNYKVRSFYEKDTGTAGADVIIYDDSGDVVDTLLITTESTYNDLVDQLEGIDEKYLDRTDVLNILQNTSNEIVAINATLLNGQSADFYAKNNHNHDNIYAPKSHVNVISQEGVLGHTKIINNVTRDSFVNGEALSAYQGKLLNDKINEIAPAAYDSGWLTFPLATWASVTHYANQPVRYRRVGKMVQIIGAVATTAVFGATTDGVYVGNIPVGFRPSQAVSALQQGSGTARHQIQMFSNGDFSVGNRYSNGTKNIEIPKNAWLNCAMTYFVD